MNGRQSGSDRPEASRQEAQEHHDRPPAATGIAACGERPVINRR